MMLAGLVFSANSVANAAEPEAMSTATVASTQAKHTGVLAELHKAHALLEKADHDYDGRRAKAAHEVKRAIHELKGEEKPKTESTTPATSTTAKPATTGKTTEIPKAAGTAPKMSQEESDKHLREAEAILSKALTQMPSGHKAATNVQNAVGEIKSALKIK
jgi:hypothetical protein